jgi:hypothetical protein
MTPNTISQWTTHFYVGNVKQHDEIVKALSPYLNDPSYFTEPWIYSKCKSTCQSPRNYELPWNVFYEAIKDNVNEYLQSLGPTCEYKISSNEVWLNVYEQHGFQEIHDHAFPNRAFSCAYMFALPDTESGQLIFENTSFPVVQATGINRIFNAFNCEKFIPQIEEGTLVIFPSWAKHYVLPNNSTHPRITISANFSVEGFYK